MIAKIVCAGVDSFESLYQQDESELMIGVDGGIYNIANLGLKVDLGIGDFDSCNIEDVIMHCKRIKKFPKEKDLGDLELAIEEIADLNVDKIIIYNATKDRLDHFVANLNILIKYAHKYDIEMVDAKNSIKVINKTSVFKKSKYQYLSIFPVEEGTIISLKGFKYNLSSYHLKLNDNLCLSNEIVDEGIIEVNNKKLLILETL